MFYYKFFNFYKFYILALDINLNKIHHLQILNVKKIINIYNKLVLSVLSKFQIIFLNE